VKLRTPDVPPALRQFYFAGNGHQGAPSATNAEPAVSPVDTILPHHAAHEDVQAAAEAARSSWTGVRATLMSKSVAYFASEMLRGPSGPPYNGKWIAGAHHLEWDDILLSNKRACVLAARDHGKSFFFSFAFPIWRLAFFPKVKIAIFSATLDQAIRILADIREELEENPKLQWLLPAGHQEGAGRGAKSTWKGTQLTTSNGGKIIARGFGTKVRGTHPDDVICDDVLNDEDAWSPLIRSRHIEYYFSAISNLPVPGGRILTVGTPFAGDDLYANLAENKRYAFRKFPALNEDGTPLWPDRYSKEELEAKQEEIGSLRFTREFKVEPMSDETSLFPDRLFRGDPVEQKTVCLGSSYSFWRKLGIHSFYVGVDLALSAEAGADWTVIFVLGVDVSGNRWIIDVQREKGLAYHQQLSLIFAVGKKYDPDFIFIEANQMQRIFSDELIRQSDLPIVKFTTSGNKKNEGTPKAGSVVRNKHTLEGGVPSLRVILENKKIRIPLGDERSVVMMEKWINEMKHFQYVNGELKGVSEKDDMVMAFWIAEQAAGAGGFSFSTGDEDEAAEGEEPETTDDIIEELSQEPKREKLTSDPIVDFLEKLGKPIPEKRGLDRGRDLTMFDEDDLDDEDEEDDMPVPAKSKRPRLPGIHAGAR
jgi:hypothetical protein